MQGHIRLRLRPLVTQLALIMVKISVTGYGLYPKIFTSDFGDEAEGPSGSVLRLDCRNEDRLRPRHRDLAFHHRVDAAEEDVFAGFVGDGLELVPCVEHSGFGG